MTHQARLARLGDRARTALRHDGIVIAVFARSLYVETPHGLACIGSPGIGAGPLNAELAGPIDWPRLGVRTGMPVQRRGSRLRLGDIVIELASARRWQPHGASRLSRLRGDGLARHLPAFARQTRAAGAIRLAGRLLRMTAAGPRDLLGLGPGLTPAGDDFLGGMLIAWRGIGAHASADRLARHVLQAGTSRTSTISRAHLAAAADGLGHAALHALLDRATPARRRRLAAIGHTSGWDALAGAVAALAISRYQSDRAQAGARVGPPRRSIRRR